MDVEITKVLMDVKIFESSRQSFTHMYRRNRGDQDNILADEQHKQFLYLGVWAPWITILSMEY